MIIPLLNQSVESFTGYVGVIDSDHAYIHLGMAFTAIVDTGTISSLYKISFKTPKLEDHLWVHWRPIGISTSAQYIEVNLYEGDSFSGGTTVPVINRNRNSTEVTSVQSIVKGSTVTLNGTLISSTGIGTEGRRTASGGGAAADQELLLKGNTNYSIGITPAGSTACLLELFWYEEGRGV